MTYITVNAIEQLFYSYHFVSLARDYNCSICREYKNRTKTFEMGMLHTNEDESSNISISLHQSEFRVVSKENWFLLSVLVMKWSLTADQCKNCP